MEFPGGLRIWPCYCCGVGLILFPEFLHASEVTEKKKKEEKCYWV